MESSRSKLLLSQENHLYEECSVCGVYCVLVGWKVISWLPSIQEIKDK